MPETTRQIIGLEKAITSSRNGALANFHVVKQFSVSYISGASSVSLAGYVSREVFEAGLEFVMLETLTLNALPTSGRIEDLPTWFAKQLLGVSGHQYHGATPVHARIDGEAERAVGPSDEEPAA